MKRNTKLRRLRYLTAAQRLDKRGRDMERAGNYVYLDHAGMPLDDDVSSQKWRCPYCGKMIDDCECE